MAALAFGTPHLDRWTRRGCNLRAKPRLCLRWSVHSRYARCGLATKDLATGDARRCHGGGGDGRRGHNRRLKYQALPGWGARTGQKGPSRASLGGAGGESSSGRDLVRLVGLEPTLREERVFETPASTIPPQPHAGTRLSRPSAAVNRRDGHGSGLGLARLRVPPSARAVRGRVPRSCHNRRGRPRHSPARTSAPAARRCRG